MTGTIFVVVLVGATMLGGWYVQILFGLIVLFGLYEFYNLFDSSDSKPQKLIGTITGTVFYFCLALERNFIHPYNRYLFITSISLVLVSFIFISIFELFRKSNKPFENIALTYSGIIYLTLPFILLNDMGNTGTLLNFKYNFWPILSIFIFVWCNDTFAYLTGRLLGKHKLFERISPKKTWEGFIGGIIFAVIAGILMAYFLQWSYAKMITYALVVGVIGTAGDLVESMLKRSVDVKDSGTILPGHGGILDRFDAVLFVVPVIYFLENFIFNSLD